MAKKSIITEANDTIWREVLFALVALGIGFGTILDWLGLINLWG